MKRAFLLFLVLKSFWACAQRDVQASGAVLTRLFGEPVSAMFELELKEMPGSTDTYTTSVKKRKGCYCGKQPCCPLAGEHTSTSGIPARLWYPGRVIISGWQNRQAKVIRNRNVPVCVQILFQYCHPRVYDSILGLEQMAKGDRLDGSSWTGYASAGYCV